jgi:hypothetical protein
VPAADPEEEEEEEEEAEPGGKSARRPPAMDAGGGVQAQGVNPDCPNAANPFHRCAEYCPVPAPRAAPKTSPPRSRPAQNGTRNGDGGKRVVPADGSEEERAVNPDCPNASDRFHTCAEYCPAPPPRAAAKSPSPPPPPGPGYAAQNGTAHRDVEECEITAADDSDEAGESVEESPELGGARRSARPPAKDEVARGERQWQGVNPDCPNAVNPFHRCAEYCPVPPPRAAAKHLAAGRGDDGSTHSDPGGLHPRPRRRDKGGGSGGLPLYVFRKRLFRLPATPASVAATPQANFHLYAFRAENSHPSACHRSSRRFRWRRQEGGSSVPQRTQPVPRLHRPLPRQDG